MLAILSWPKKFWNGYLNLPRPQKLPKVWLSWMESCSPQSWSPDPHSWCNLQQWWQHCSLQERQTHLWINLTSKVPHPVSMKPLNHSIFYKPAIYHLFLQTCGSGRNPWYPKLITTQESVSRTFLSSIQEMTFFMKRNLWSSVNLIFLFGFCKRIEPLTIVKSRKSINEQIILTNNDNRLRHGIFITI